MHRLCPVWGIGGGGAAPLPDARWTGRAKNEGTKRRRLNFEIEREREREKERERARELIFSLRPASISDRFAMPDREERNTLEDEIKSQNLARRRYVASFFISPLRVF